MPPLSTLRHAQWAPISETHLQQLIAEAEEQMTPEQASLWRMIRLPVAEIWQQRPWADEGCGFWVVATFGKSCIYFNDLSQSFAASLFDRWGNICKFDPRPASLPQLLNSCQLRERLDGLSA